MNEKYDKRIFARNLLYYMAVDRLNQTDVAHAVKVSNSTVHDWMQAKKTPRMDKLQVLARLFNCTITDLIDEHGNEIDDLTSAQRDLLALLPTLTPEEISVLSSTAKALKAARRGQDHQG